jgi:Transposase and inactivated derivatives
VLETRTEFPTDVESLLAIIAAKDTELEQLRNEYERKVESLIEIIRDLRRKRFGKSSEKASPHQLGLFNEAEEAAAVSEDPSDETETEAITYVRKKPKRKPLPADLPREERVIEIPESERLCPNGCGSVMNEIGEEVSEKFDIVPMQIKVIRTVRKKYACTHKDCGLGGVKTAPNPPALIPKSNASEGLLAAICTMKYVDHLPLYRLEAIFKRHDIDLTRGTMGSWMVRCGQAVQPLINLLHEELVSSDYIQMDETRTQVLNEEGKRAESKSYMWVRYRPGRYPIVLFTYDPSRSGEVPVRLLDGFEGHLQVDGYDGYSQVIRKSGGKITRGGCMAHARRKLKSASDSSKKAGIANKGLKFIQKLYKFEEQARYRSPEERYRIRQLKAKPVIEEMRKWLDQVLNSVPPESLVGQALRYLHNEWEHLMKYLEDGRYEIDNNDVENVIRPFALGRKNWLFSSTVEGAEASANIYSLIETAKANYLDPYDYLKYVFEKLPLAQTLEDFEALLPASVKAVFAAQDIADK